MNSGLASSESSSLPRVAVIAVHGVNTHEPFVTARTIAKMLLRPEPRQRSEYPEFKETLEDTFVECLSITDADGKDHSKDRPSSWFDERAPSIRHAQKPGQPASASAIPLDHQYMADQLREYKVRGDDAFYDTIRIEGTRTDPNAKPQCRVHIFELYWADLSRRAFGVFQGFIELYEILFFLCSLGRKTLDFARAAHPGSRWWSAFGSVQVVAERILVLAVPIINLCMLAIGITLLSALLPEARTLSIWMIAAYGVAIPGVVAFVLFRWSPVGEGPGWPKLFVPIALVAAAAVVLYRQNIVPAYEYRVLASLWVFAVLGGVVIVCKLYDKMRRGALASGAITVLFTLLLFIIEVWIGSPAAGEKNDQLLVLGRTFRTGEWLLITLNIAWIIFLLFVTLMTITGWGATRFSCRCDPPGRCNRAAWTAQITMILPASLIVVLTSAFWKILIWLLLRLPGTGLLRGVTISPIDLPQRLTWLLPSGIALPQSQAIGSGEGQLPKLHYVLKNLIDAQGNNLVPLCVVLGVVAALSIWALSPAIFTEFVPPSPSKQTSSWLGFNLNAGYKTLRFAGEILRWTFILSFVAFVLSLAGQQSLVQKAIGSFDSYLTTLGYGPALIAALGCAVGIILIAAQGPLEPLALGFKSVIDVALDVVAWLRIRPKDQNPKGRICARYVSLLRHVCNEHLSGANYKGIVIVAYSQGTVITVDLLRFLFFQYKHQHDENRLKENESDKKQPNGKQPDKKDPLLATLFGEGLPLYLMTFGNPLRQLYDLRFPHLYSFAFGAGLSGEGPCPDDLGVAAWLNGYRSGDYVGRCLWQADSESAAWDLAEKAEVRGDFCLGAGAHTHYFDETAPRVPIWLDHIINHILGRN